jgi:hypothetical protein
MSIKTFNVLQSVVDHLRETGELELLLAYEDLDMGLSAKRLCNLIAHSKGFCQPDRPRMWKLSVLAMDEMREVSAGDLQESNVVVFAARFFTPLIVAESSWLDDWFHQRHAQSKAVFLLSPMAPASGSQFAVIADRLRGKARRAGVDFVCLDPQSYGEANPNPLEAAAELQTIPVEFNLPSWVWPVPILKV